jgi:hypothetical protein
VNWLVDNPEPDLLRNPDLEAPLLVEHDTDVQCWLAAREVQVVAHTIRALRAAGVEFPSPRALLADWLDGNPEPVLSELEEPFVMLLGAFPTVEDAQTWIRDSALRIRCFADVDLAVVNTYEWINIEGVFSRDIPREWRDPRENKLHADMIESERQAKELEAAAALEGERLSHISVADDEARTTERLPIGLTEEDVLRADEARRRTAERAREHEALAATAEERAAQAIRARATEIARRRGIASPTESDLAAIEHDLAKKDAFRARTSAWQHRNAEFVDLTKFASASGAASDAQDRE